MKRILALIGIVLLMMNLFTAAFADTDEKTYDVTVMVGMGGIYATNNGDESFAPGSEYCPGIIVTAVSLDNDTVVKSAPKAVGLGETVLMLSQSELEIFEGHSGYKVTAEPGIVVFYEYSNTLVHYNSETNQDMHDITVFYRDGGIYLTNNRDDYYASNPEPGMGVSVCVWSLDDGICYISTPSRAVSIGETVLMVSEDELKSALEGHSGFEAEAVPGIVVMYEYSNMLTHRFGEFY